MLIAVHDVVPLTGTLHVNIMIPAPRIQLVWTTRRTPLAMWEHVNVPLRAAQPVVQTDSRNQVRTFFQRLIGNRPARIVTHSTVAVLNGDRPLVSPCVRVSPRRISVPHSPTNTPTKLEKNTR